MGLSIIAVAAMCPGFASAAHARAVVLHPVFHRVAVVLHPVFHRVAIDAYLWSTSPVLSNSGYVFIGTPLAPGGQLGLLFDEATGGRVAIVGPAGCGAQDIGGPWVLFGCGSGESSFVPELYSISTGRWQSVVLNPALQSFDERCMEDGDPTCGAGAVAVGTDWIEFGEDCGYHCGTSYVFQNIQTGQLESDRTATGARTVPDLNTPVLAERLCSPVRTFQPWIPDGGSDLGSVTFDGRFALLKDGSGTILERCGSKLEKRIPAHPAANAREVIWWTAQHHIYGLLLPSLRPIEIATPPSAKPGRIFRSVFLGAHRLYVLTTTFGGDGSATSQFWTAALPR